MKTNPLPNFMSFLQGIEVLELFQEKVSWIFYQGQNVFTLAVLEKVGYLQLKIFQKKDFSRV